MTGQVGAAKLLFKKASTACLSARLLLDAGDSDGALNRAYYAMFDAARASLIGLPGLGSLQEMTRTHSGLISAFGLHLVKPGLVSRELGRQLNRAHEARLIADYSDESMTPEDARVFVDVAVAFVEELERASPSFNI